MPQRPGCMTASRSRSEEHTSELQSPDHLVCRLLLEKKKTNAMTTLVGTITDCGLELQLRGSIRPQPPLPSYREHDPACNLLRVTWLGDPASVTSEPLSQTILVTQSLCIPQSLTVPITSSADLYSPLDVTRYLLSASLTRIIFCIVPHATVHFFFFFF